MMVHFALVFQFICHTIDFMENAKASRYYGPDSIALGRSRFMSRVYLWMSGGVFVTAAVAYYVASSETLLMAIFGNRMVFFGLIIGELVAVIALSAAINRMSLATATFMYFLYAALTGTTLAAIFIVYTQESIATVFAATACAFGGLSIIGYTTKRDLGPLGAFCGMALFGLIGYGILSFFIPSLLSDSAMMLYSGAGVLLFAGLTAYDTQKIRMMYQPSADGTEAMAKGAIIGALALYLDFINLFLSLLRLFGRRR